MSPEQIGLVLGLVALVFLGFLFGFMTGYTAGGKDERDFYE